MSNYRAFIFAAAISICTVVIGSSPGGAGCQRDQVCQGSCGGGCGPCSGGGGGNSSSGGGGNGLDAVQAQAVNNQGLAAQNAGNFPLAQSYLEQALRLNPYDTVIANNLRRVRVRVLNDQGGVAYKAGNYAAAVRFYEQALSLKTPEEEGSEALKQMLKNARAGNSPGKKTREAVSCRIALESNEKVLQREPWNTVVTAMVQDQRARCGGQTEQALSLDDRAGLKDAPNDKKKGKTKPVLKDPRPVADNNDFVCTKWPANGKFWCTGTTGKYATRACKWCPGDKISNLCAKAPCDQ